MSDLTKYRGCVNYAVIIFANFHLDLKQHAVLSATDGFRITKERESFVKVRNVKR